MSGSTLFHDLKDMEPPSDYELMECVERALDRFGPGVKYAVMWRMIVLGNPPKRGILVDPDAFIAALQSIFGRSAKLIEQAVLDEIKARSGSEYSEIDDLSKLVNLIRRENLCIQ